MFPTPQTNPCQNLKTQVRGSAWVIAKRKPNPPDGHTTLQLGGATDVDGDRFELHCMTSATLIEALYSAVDDWLQENTGGKQLTQLDEQDWVDVL